MEDMWGIKGVLESLGNTLNKVRRSNPIQSYGV
jgi:hypothetical protein